MDNTTPAPIQPQAASTEDKTAAILSYITILGFIVAIIIHNGKKTALGAYHLRQALGFMILGVVVYVCFIVLAFIPIVRVLDLIAFRIMGIAMLVLWIMGLIAAVNARRSPCPLLGRCFSNGSALRLSDIICEGPAGCILKQSVPIRGIVQAFQRR
jgi:uncharacterized membrane protein